jgi:uncharacterized membrane protein
MKHSVSSVLFCVLLVFAAVFVSLTASLLPSEVASHFSTAGAADGFMPRTAYLVLMLALALAMPVVMVLTLGSVLRKPRAPINLPNRDYWLGPERRADTVAFLQRHMLRFGSLLIAFICFVHWLVVRANAHEPARLSDSWLVAGIVLFIVATALWVGALHLRFRHRA